MIPIRKGREFELFKDAAACGAANMALSIAKKGKAPDAKKAEDFYNKTFDEFANKWLKYGKEDEDPTDAS